MTNKLESIAAKYLDPDDGLKVDERILEILSSNMMQYVNGPDVLEMGVGAGTYTQKIIEKFGVTNVLDASKKLLDKQKDKFGDKVKVFKSYFEEFEPNIKFDTIVATNILEHLENPILVLNKMKDWLKDGGKILIIVPNANSLHRNYGKCLGLLDNLTDLGESDFKIGHERVYTYSLIEEHICLAGLKITRKLPTFLKLLSNEQMKNFTDNQLEGLFKLAESLLGFIEYNADIFLEVVKK